MQGLFLERRKYYHVRLSQQQPSRALLPKFPNIASSSIYHVRALARADCRVDVCVLREQGPSVRSLRSVGCTRCEHAANLGAVAWCSIQRPLMTDFYFRAECSKHILPLSVPRIFLFFLKC